MLISGADAIDAASRMRGRGVSGEPRIDWRELMASKRRPLGRTKPDAKSAKRGGAAADGQADCSASRLNQENRSWRRSMTPAPGRVFGSRMKSQLAGEVVVCVRCPSDICSLQLRRQISTASVAVSRSIEPASRLLDGRAVLSGPQAETADGLEQGMSELCELVIDSRRSGRERGASHK